ncbi:MAG TPA: preprotein translocase subunit SecE [Paludibaculum sp.]|jgi:preprotein translocase subunit SecE
MAAETTAVTGTNDAPKGAMAWLQSAKDYIADLKAEMRRVTWPSQEQVKATTAVVIGAVFLFAAYFAVVDLILGRAINQIFQTLARR